jgi:hypothetical protein
MADHFQSVAKCLGCGEDKTRFAAKPGILTRVGTTAKQRHG